MAGASRRDLIYRMRVDPDGFKRGMSEAGQSTRAYHRELRKLEREQAAVDKMMTQTGTVMMGAGAAILAGLGMATKAAIDWESAWVGVAKVIEGTPEQLDALEAELRQLARTLPQSHEEIAGVAAAAGQLGIATEDIADFTKTMVDLGVSSTLSSQEAAFAIARMTTIMQSAPDDVRNLASALVDLGNNSAATESEIMQMALRISGAGSAIGLTEADVLAFGSALSSVGVRAEAGGSAISRAFITIDSAVREGSDGLNEFADVAGVSADEFASAFRDRPAEAVEMFISGLGRMNDSGEDVFATLQNLGMSEIRLRDALLRLAGAGDLVAESLELGNRAWDENIALTEEANRRYGTAESRMEIAKNQLYDFGISMGQVVVPAISRIVSTLTAFIDVLNDLPQPVIAGLTILAGLVGTVALLGGAALIAIPRIQAFNLALAQMSGPVATRAQTALRGISSFLFGPWGIAIGVAVAALTIFAARQAETRARVNELTGTLDDQSGAITENSRAWIAHQLEERGAAEAAQELGIELSTLVDAIAGQQHAIEEVNAVLDENEKKYRAHSRMMADGELTEDAQKVSDAFSELADDVEQASEQHDRHTEAVHGSSEAMDGAALESQILADQLGVTTEVAEEASDGFDDLDRALKTVLDTLWNVQQGERAVADEVERLTDLIDENSATLDQNTDEGRRNADQVERLITEMFDLVVATAESTGSQEEAMKVASELEDEFRDLMEQLGFTEDQIDDYAQAFDAIPDLVETTVQTNYTTQGTQAPTITDSVPAPMYSRGGRVSGPGTGVSDSIMARVSDGEFVVRESATRNNRQLLEAINAGRTPVLPASNGNSSGEVVIRFEGDEDMVRILRKGVRARGGVNVVFGGR